MIADPDEYDSLNELEVGNYIQRHYIEKEGLRIDFLSEDEEEDHEEEVEVDVLLLELHKDPSHDGNVPASSSGTFDDLMSLNLSQPAGEFIYADSNYTQLIIPCLKGRSNTDS